MVTYLVTHTPLGGRRAAKRVEARTPEAAARKVFGRNTSFGRERDTMAGAVRVLEFSTVRGDGEVQWAKEPNIRLVRYALRPDDAPFWTDPEAWVDAEKHPLAVLG